MYRIGDYDFPSDSSSDNDYDIPWPGRGARQARLYPPSSSSEASNQSVNREDGGVEDHHQLEEIVVNNDDQQLQDNNEGIAEVNNAPVAGFRVRVGPDGSETFEFESNSDELTSDDDEADADWQEAIGVQPAVEHHLPNPIFLSIASRYQQGHRQQRRAHQTALSRISDATVNSSSPGPSHSRSSEQLATGESTSTPSRRRKRRKKKAVAKKKTPKVKRAKQAPKPLGPLVIEEDWSGNDNHKEYLKKISSRTGNFSRVYINIRDDQEFNKSSTSPLKRRSSSLYSRSQESQDIHGRCNDVSMQLPSVEVESSNSKSNETVTSLISQNETCETSPEIIGTGISGYRIAQLQFDRCSMHSWPWKNKSELLDAHPCVTDLILYANNQPGASIFHMKTKRTLQGKAVAERRGPPPQLSKRNSARELIYVVTEHFFFHADPVGIPLDLFSIRGLGNRKTFALDFNSFDTEKQCFLIDVVVLDSVILGDHDVHEIPGGRPSALQDVYTNLLGIVPPLSPGNEQAQQREDIDWFYGQIKKYHKKEELPASDIPLQPPSLKPTLRPYQSDAVNWMLFREGCLDHCVAHSSTAYQNRIDLISAFLDKMYIQVELTRHNQIKDSALETKLVYYNPYSSYLCWSKPTIPAMPSGGILCDEMGLGKTVETLCLILLNKKPVSEELLECLKDQIQEDKNETSDNSSESESSDDKSNKNMWSDSSDESFKGKRKKTQSAKQNKKKKVVSKANVRPKRRTAQTKNLRPRRRAPSPCEFTVAGSDDTSQSPPTSDPSLFRRRPSSTGPSTMTVLDFVEANLSPKKCSGTSTTETCDDQPKKKTKMYDVLKVLYDSSLNNFKYAERAKSTPKFHGRFYETSIEPRAFFECICGEPKYNNEEVVQCSVCSSSQHARCVGFDRDLKAAFRKIGRDYLCPHCEALEPPFETKSTLIITPQSISHQWIKEIQRHVQNNQLKILFYKGVSVHGYIPPAKLARYDIVITTYNVLSSELDYVDLPHCNSADGRRFRNPKRFLTIPSPLPSVLWWRACLDEAQMVEGIGTKMSMMAMKLHAIHRWCVTGTPMNKGLQDLFGLFVFLKVYPISYDTWWNVLVRDAFLLKDTSLLYELFGQMIWRNGKQDVLDQLGIPPQTEIIHWLNFSPVETHFYKQQFEIGSQRIIEKIGRLQRLWPNVEILTSKLSSLDRFTLHGLLAPFLELRQACCHPQIVKGQLISLQKGTMSMEELLDNLIKKTRLQCHEDHRLIIAALNGMAGLYYILDNFKEAAEKYREALQSAEKQKEHFETDSLQLLHAMENLAEILDGNHAGVPFTLRDHTLRSDAADVRAKYMKKYADAVKSAQEAVAPLSAAVDQIREQFTMLRESWWVAALKQAERMQKIDDLIHNLKQDLLDVTKKNVKNTNSIANKFYDQHGLELALVPTLVEMDELRDTVLDGLEELKTSDTSTFVESAIRCHLRQKSTSYYNDSGLDEEEKCKLCLYHDNFLLYESVIFKNDTKNKINRMGRNYQKNKLLGELADELSEMTTVELLQQEAEDFKATTEHVQLINDELKRGNWGDSETEMILKGILRFAKTNKLPNEIVENGGIHVKVMDAIKKEFRYLRILWRQIYDEVSARDELSQATTRLIAVRGHHPEDQELAGPSVAKNIKSLRSGIMEKTLKIQNIHVIGFHEIDPKLSQMQADFALGHGTLAVHLGQLLYLKTLKRNGYGRKGTLNTEDCPICSVQLGKEWSVLRCGHSFCSDCVKQMCPNALHSFLCPLCRHSMKYADVSFVDTSDQNNLRTRSSDGGESSKRTREVKGSHSTKVEAIIETLLQLQETHPGEKCIIFSTWNNVLEIIAGALQENDIKYSLMNQSGKAFHNNLDKFKEREDLQVLLMPLTSGSKGLNIIEATHVLLVEPILNLASELQAIGRVHRIGQTKPTFIHRFYIKRTIEEKLFKILKAQDISSDEEGCLTVNDLKALVSSAVATTSSAASTVVNVE